MTPPTTPVGKTGLVWTALPTQQRITAFTLSISAAKWGENWAIDVCLALYTNPRGDVTAETLTTFGVGLATAADTAHITHRLGRGIALQ